MVSLEEISSALFNWLNNNSLTLCGLSFFTNRRRLTGLGIQWTPNITFDIQVAYKGTELHFFSWYRYHRAKFFTEYRYQSYLSVDTEI